MDKALRNTLRTTITQCRRLLEDATAELLEGQFGIHMHALRLDPIGRGRIDHPGAARRQALPQPARVPPPAAVLDAARGAPVCGAVRRPKS